MNSIASEIERARLIAGLDQPAALQGALKIEESQLAAYLPARLILYLFRSGFSEQSIDALLVRILGVSCVFLILLFVHPVFLGFWALYLLVEFRLVVKNYNARAEAFDKDYPALLLGLAASAKAGLDPIQALCEARHLFPEESVMHEILVDFHEQTEKGKTAEECLTSFAEKVYAQDIHLFRTAMVLHLQEGASVAQALQRLTRVNRQRQSFRRKIRASVAVQRLSSLGIIIAFLCILGFQVVNNAQSLLLAYQHPVGFKLLAFGVGLLVLGSLWMKKVLATRVGC